MPSFVGILEGINIRLLRPVVVTVEHQEDSQAENNESKDKEEPEEILHIVSEVGSVVLLVPFLNPSTFFIKHLIDLTDMLLHLSGHPFMLFVEHVLNLLPVNIIDSDCKPKGRFFWLPLAKYICTPSLHRPKEPSLWFAFF